MAEPQVGCFKIMVPSNCNPTKFKKNGDVTFQPEYQILRSHLKMHVLKCIPQKTGPSNNPIFMGPWRFCTWWCATRGYVCSPHTSDICTDSKEFSPLGFNTRCGKIQMTNRYNSVFRNCAWLGKRTLPWFHKMFFCWEKDVCYSIFETISPYYQ